MNGMRKYRLFLSYVAFLALAGCVEQSLQLTLRFEQGAGLKAGDVLVLGDQQVGRVDAVESSQSGTLLAQAHIDAKYRVIATTATRFYLADAPDGASGKRIELEFSGGGRLLEDGASVDGESRGGLEQIFPLGTILKGMGEGLRQFRDQMDRFQRDMEKMPNSDDAKKLEEEWKRLLEQMEKAGKGMEKELAPRLQELDKRFRQLQPQPPSRPEPPPVRQREGYNI